MQSDRIRGLMDALFGGRPNTGRRQPKESMRTKR
jgi:hypothetical protein